MKRITFRPQCIKPQTALLIIAFRRLHVHDRDRAAYAKEMKLELKRQRSKKARKEDRDHWVDVYCTTHEKELING
jgi:hypothetical protein